MKKGVLAVLFTCLGSAAFAGGSNMGSNAEALYAALNVEQVRRIPESALAVYTKSVGGISCKKVIDLTMDVKDRSNISFNCSASFSSMDQKAIYEALSVQEEKIAGREEPTYRKQVGGLACQKTMNALNDFSVQCKLSF